MTGSDPQQTRVYEVKTSDMDTALVGADIQPNDYSHLKRLYDDLSAAYSRLEKARAEDAQHWVYLKQKLERRASRGRQFEKAWHKAIELHQQGSPLTSELLVSLTPRTSVPPSLKTPANKQEILSAASHVQSPGLCSIQSMALGDRHKRTLGNYITDERHAGRGQPGRMFKSTGDADEHGHPDAAEEKGLPMYPKLASADKIRSNEVDNAVNRSPTSSGIRCDLPAVRSARPKGGNSNVGDVPPISHCTKDIQNTHQTLPAGADLAPYTSPSGRTDLRVSPVADGKVTIVAAPANRLELLVQPFQTTAHAISHVGQDSDLKAGAFTVSSTSRLQHLPAAANILEAPQDTYEASSKRALPNVTSNPAQPAKRWLGGRKSVMQRRDSFEDDALPLPSLPAEPAKYSSRPAFSDMMGDHTRTVRSGQKQKRERDSEGEGTRSGKKAKSRSSIPGDLARYVVNADRNNGVSHFYHSIERNKQHRCALDGEACDECRSWYEATKDIANTEPIRFGATPLDQDALISDDQSQLQRQNLMDQISRHRAEAPKNPTPPGYWDTGMPGTAIVDQWNAAADLQVEQKRDRQRQEALKSNGRWIALQ